MSDGPDNTRDAVKTLRGGVSEARGILLCQMSEAVRNFIGYFGTPLGRAKFLNDDFLSEALGFAENLEARTGYQLSEYSDALLNFVGILDTPLGRMRFSSCSYVQEAVNAAKKALQSYSDYTAVDHE